MSTIEQDGKTHEIIIVRRARHDEDEAHHGGVWKIAFADFMTALMCFFLVMWLINAANEETRAALASYFNPVKLIDRNTSRKGLDEIGGPQSRESAPESAEDDSTLMEDLTEPSQPAPTPRSLPTDQKSDAGPRSDEHLFSDPYAVLAEIAADTGKLQNTSSKGDGGAQTSGPASGASGGESYRDPFAPDFWSQQVDVPQAAATSQSEAAVLENLAAPEIPSSEELLAETPDADNVDPRGASEQVGESAEIALPRGEAEAAAGPAAKLGPRPDITAAQAGDVEPPAALETADEEKKLSEAEKAAEAEASAAQRVTETEKTAEAIRQELAEAVGANGQLEEGVSVTVTDEGVMISVTDEIDSGMFEIGSAVPRRDLVLAMEKIGKILSGREGRVTINGHTDGRPFRSENYDNWRLSTARAHSAYFMLVRGGLEEPRIVEVAGFADRKLKIADDPFADANRRIEILLESGG